MSFVLIIYVVKVVDKRNSILYTLGRGDVIMKKLILLSVVLFAILLTGCDVEKTITIENAQPDELLLQTLLVLKDELPTTRLNIDPTTKTISYNNPSITDYPYNLVLSFQNNRQNTNVLFVAKDTDENKVNKLKTLLNNKYITYTTEKINQQKIIDEEDENIQPIQLRRMDLTSEQ